MEQELSVYIVRVDSLDGTSGLKDHVEKSNYDEDFSAAITSEEPDGFDTLYRVEVTGTPEETVLFEEGFAEIPDAEIASPS